MLYLVRTFGLAPGNPSTPANGRTNIDEEVDADTPTCAGTDAQENVQVEANTDIDTDAIAVTGRVTETKSTDRETTGLASGSTMSARLPPELWLQILSLACSVPGELNSNATSLFERPVHSDACRARAKLLRTRRSLTLVCRSFYNLATPLLYGPISLDRRRLLDLLLITMQDSGQMDAQNQVTTTTRSHGWWTRRLDLNLTRIGRWHGFKVADLRALLLHMPKLEILVVFPSDAFFLPIAKVLHPGTNLKLVSVPSFEWLSYNDNNDHNTDIMVSTTTTTTPLPYYARLRECIPTNKSRISEVYMSNIHLHLDKSNNRYPDIRGILPMDPWLVHFPNLRRVILDVQQWNWIFPSSSSFICAAVRDIGLTRMRMMSLKRYYKRISRRLARHIP